jgi:hypothetical protein
LFDSSHGTFLNFIRFLINANSQHTPASIRNITSP